MYTTIGYNNYDKFQVSQFSHDHTVEVLIKKYYYYYYFKMFLHKWTVSLRPVLHTYPCRLTFPSSG